MTSRPTATSRRAGSQKPMALPGLAGVTMSGMPA